MGNEISAPVESIPVELYANQSRSQSFDHLDTSAWHIAPTSSRETKDESSDDEKPKRRKGKHLDGGSLRGTLAANQEPMKAAFVDPILLAASAGAKARKTKKAFLLRNQELQKQQSEKERLEEKQRIDNEWKSSLRRLASAAVSTATTVVQVTAPVLKEAKTVVQTSTKEFAQELQSEWNKPDEPQFEHEEESVQLFPSTPIWRTPSRLYDLSPSITPSQMRVIQAGEVLTMPSFGSRLFPHHSPEFFDGRGGGSTTILEEALQPEILEEMADNLADVPKERKFSVTLPKVASTLDPSKDENANDDILCTADDDGDCPYNDDQSLLSLPNKSHATGYDEDETIIDKVLVVVDDKGLLHEKDFSSTTPINESSSFNADEKEEVINIASAGVDKKDISVDEVLSTNTLPDDLVAASMTAEEETIVDKIPVVVDDKDKYPLHDNGHSSTTPINESSSFNADEK